MYCPPEILNGHFKDSAGKEPNSETPGGTKKLGETPGGKNLGWHTAEPSARSELSILEADGPEEPFSPPDGRKLGWQAADPSTRSEFSVLEADGSQEPRGARSSDLAQALTSDAYTIAWRRLNRQLQVLAKKPELNEEIPIRMFRFSC